MEPSGNPTRQRFKYQGFAPRWPLRTGTSETLSPSRPKVCYASGKGKDAMIIVVEIASRAGTPACKEYDAPSYNAAVEVVKRELRAYPVFRVTGIWIKDDQMVQRETANEW